MELETIHISKGYYKMEEIDSISTDTTKNEYCLKQSKNKNSICFNCFSFRTLNYKKSLLKVLDKNSRLLSKGLIAENLLPTIYKLYFRFNSHGELINLIHLKNLVNIIIKNPQTTFALWSKRFDLIKEFFDKNEKPKNLILVYSNSKLNKPLEKLPKYFNKTFNNITKDKVEDFKINCFQKCKDCLACYTHNNIKTIIEKVK